MKYIFLLCLIVGNTYASFDQSHQKLTSVLKLHSKMVGNQTLVDYKGLKNNRSELDEYISELEAVDKSLFQNFSSDEKLAFWINAYNAYTLDIVLRNYPVSSIKKISSGGFLSSVTNSGPWKKKFIELMGKTLSLDNIEHDIIRKEFSEPRIHFAVNCASIGCPSLLRDAFQGSKLDEQLQKATKNFMDNKEKNYIDGNKLVISKIFEWYGSDFDKKHGGYENFVRKFFPQLPKDAKITFGDYNWDLNKY